MSESGVYNPRDYGAVGNESIATTGSIAAGSSQLTVASSNGSTNGFAVGNYLTVKGAGARTVPGSIAAGSNELTLSSSAGFVLDTYVRVAVQGTLVLFAQIRNIVDNTLTLSENAVTTITDASVTNDGVLYDARITAINGNVLTLDRSASATVSNAAVKIDDHPAFVACLEDMRAQVNPVGYGSLWYGSKVVIQPGVKDPTQSTGMQYGFGFFGYRLSRPLHITSCCVIEGTGGNHWPSTILHFDPGVTGIIVDYPDDRGMPHQRARGDGTVIKHIGLVGSTARGSGSIESLAGGSYSLPWQPGKAMAPGDVRVPSTYRQNLWGKAIICLTGGTTSSNYLDEPNWNAAGNDSGIYTESTGVVWKMIDCDGIFIQAACKIENCFVFAFSGNGINYQALGWPAAIANNAKILDNRVIMCGGNGIRANGNDANQGWIAGNDVNQCYGYGYVDTTLLSCVWNANHGAECLRGPAWFDHGRVYGHYAEGSQGPIHLTQHATWVHGIAGANSGDGFDSLSKLQRGKIWSANAAFGASTVVYPTVDNGYYYWSSTGGTTGGTEPNWPLGRGKTVVDGNVTWYCYGPSAVQQRLNILHQNTMTPMQFLNTTGAHKTQFEATTVNSDEFFAWKSALDSPDMTSGYSLMGPDGHHYGWQALSWNRGPWLPFCLSTPRAVQHGTAQAPGMLQIPHPFYLGSPYYDRILQHVGTAPPTTGAWLLGSIVWNANPAANGLRGWLCVAAGSPGTWVPIGMTGGRIRHNMTSDADYVLTGEHRFASIVEITDTGSALTTVRSIILPGWDGMERTVSNGTNIELIFKTAGGYGVVLYPGENRHVYCDGTNIVAVN